jgi:hypothetical protein
MTRRLNANGDPAPRPPVLPLTAAVIAFGNAVTAAVVAFGLELDALQQASITGVLNACVILFLASSHTYRAWKHDRARWSHLNGVGE